MQELLLQIQQGCLQLRTSALVIPGLIGLIAGLFLWLGGVRYAFFVLGLLGAGLGAIAGLFLSRWFDLPPIPSIAIAAVLLSIMAIIGQRVVMMALAMVIFSIACGTLYMNHSLNSDVFKNKLSQIKQKVRGLVPKSEDAESQTLEPAEADYMRMLADQMKQEELAPVKKSHQRGLAKLKTVLAKIRLSAASNRSMFVFWAVVGAIIGLILGYLLRKIIMSFCCSVVGSASIIAAAIALFFAKGTPVFSKLQGRDHLLPGIFLCMVAFGWLVQIMFPRTAKAKIAKATEDEEHKR